MHKSEHALPLAGQVSLTFGQETLRFHPFVHSLLRWSVEEDVLPLSEPIATVDGKVLNEIPIPKGQVIMASLYCYNQ